ncbi:hypothetical protein G9A89_003960 [Geosiphon pyriformis]|nr:hypothetical protein G9A89_003960 [Geosiphon pyriformis]
MKLPIYEDVFVEGKTTDKNYFGEKELLNNTDPIQMQFDVINGKHPMIKKHTPACHETVEESQQRVIATHNNCNLNQQALILEET